MAAHGEFRAARRYVLASSALVGVVLGVWGAVQLTGSSGDSWDLNHENTTVHVDVTLTIRGSLPAMGAMCEWPTSGDLLRGTTPQNALAIVRRAGLVTTYGGEQPDSRVPHGHFYIRTSNPDWPCGRPARKLLYRS